MGVNNRGAERKDRQIEEKGIRKGKCRGLEEETEGGTKREGVKRCETEGVRRPKQDEKRFFFCIRELGAWMGVVSTDFLSRVLWMARRPKLPSLFVISCGRGAEEREIKK